MSLILYLVQVTCCLAFFYAFYHFMLRKETLFETNRFYLVITLASSIILPLIKIYIDSQSSDSAVGIAPYVYVGSYVDAISTDFAVAKSEPFPWDRLIIGIYALGIAVMAIRLLNAVKEIQWIRQHGMKTMVDGQWCILSDQVKSPFSFFNTIYFPKQHQFEETELKEIVAHELAHVRGKHTLDVLFMESACILLWPSPLIYFYRKALKDVHEFVADAAVIKDTPWENYARLLIGQQQGQLQNILSNQLMYSQLKKRLLMMNKERSGAMAGLKYLGFIPVLLIALFLFSFREKNVSEEASELITNEVQSDRIIRLSLEADKKIYFRQNEVTIEELELVLKNQIAMTNDTLLLVKVDKSTVVSDLTKIDSIGDRLNIWTVFDTGAPSENFELNEIATDAYSGDTLPASSIVALRLTAPSEENRNDLILNTQIADEQNPDLDYTLPLPIFPGCDEVVISERGMCGMTKLQDYLNKHMRYPLSLKNEGVEGRVLVKFVVGADGYVKDVAIQESLHPDADHVVLKLVNSMNGRVGKWRPARKDGKSYDAEMVLPVLFMLNHSNVKEEPLLYAEELPRFPGCEDIENEEERSACATRKLYEFIYTTIKYPEEDKVKNIQGHCIVQFVIGIDGSISDIDVKRAPSEAMKQEVIRLMKIMAESPDKWIPARHDGNAVAMQFTLPIKFMLQDDKVQNKPSPPAPTNQDNANVGQQIISSKDIPTCEDINIVPNPASETITLKVMEGSTSINIFDTLGNLLKSQKVNVKVNDKETINISGLPAGRYSVQLITTTGTVACSFMIAK